MLDRRKDHRVQAAHAQNRYVHGCQTDWQCVCNMAMQVDRYGEVVVLMTATRGDVVSKLNAFESRISALTLAAYEFGPPQADKGRMNRRRFTGKKLQPAASLWGP